MRKLFRKIKNFKKHLKELESNSHYYGYDLWNDIKNTVGEHIPKGYTLYGECLGYDKNGGEIQKGYDYGCTGTEQKLEVYRITNTTADGLVTELTYPQIAEFCERTGLTPPHLFYYGKAKDLYDIPLGEHWNQTFVENLERDYNEKDCFMCKNSVPEEGIAVRKESLFSCDTYKLKSFRFLSWETKQLDKGVVSLEDEN